METTMMGYVRVIEGFHFLQTTTTSKTSASAGRRSCRSVLGVLMLRVIAFGGI